MPFFLVVLLLGAVIFFALVIIPVERYGVLLSDIYDSRGLKVYTRRFNRSYASRCKY